MIFGLFGGGKKRIVELVAAARAGDTEKVKQLLAKGVDINASEPESGDTALLAAIDKGQCPGLDRGVVRIIHPIDHIHQRGAGPHDGGLYDDRRRGIGHGRGCHGEQNEWQEADFHGDS